MKPRWVVPATTIAVDGDEWPSPYLLNRFISDGRGKSRLFTYRFLLVLECTQNASSVSGASLDLDAARAFRNGRKLGISFAPAPTVPAPQLQARDPEQTALTFAQLKELIEQGKTDDIPNNKVIPNVLSVSLPFRHSGPRSYPFAPTPASPKLQANQRPTFERSHGKQLPLRRIITGSIV